ncbi:lysoplasmalogenase [Bacillus sp. BHET2]|uniref:lysoplasmalogenase n=1 Tax=Bacillus sp. BHET2 TaxID=2583818 RepID=UPI00110DE639|nr:lysoplasmalogenase [Bacillus sp. BHET2]TMU87228.1 lysoplasmalogenase [Bacillus sp. BHET2]
MFKRGLLPMLIGLMSVLYIFFIPPDPVALKVAFKLIPMLLIILYAVRKLPAKPSLSMQLIIVGLFICMVGDGLIAFSFVAGLGAFLLGHLIYVTGFLRMFSSNKVRLMAILPIALYSFFIGRQLIASLLVEGNDGLVIPVIAYMLVISVMAFSAIQTGNKLATAGSILFVISDSILSWNMFVSAIPYGDIFIMATYYSAQFLIANSVTEFRSKEEAKSISNSI